MTSLIYVPNLSLHKERDLHKVFIIERYKVFITQQSFPMYVILY